MTALTKSLIATAAYLQAHHHDAADVLEAIATIERLDAIVSACATLSNPDWDDARATPVAALDAIHAATGDVIAELLRREGDKLAIGYARGVEDAARRVEGEMLEDPQDCDGDVAYDNAVRDCAAAIRRLTRPGGTLDDER